MLKVMFGRDVAGKGFIVIARGPIGTVEGVHELPKPGETIHVIEATLNGAVYHGDHTVEKLAEGKVKVWEIVFEKTPNGILVHHGGEHVLYSRNFKARSDKAEHLAKIQPKEDETIAIKEGFTAVNGKIKGVLSWYIKEDTIYIQVEDKEIPLFTIRGGGIKVKSVDYGEYYPITVHLLVGGREVEIAIQGKEVLAFWYEENDNTLLTKYITFEKGLQDPKFYIFLEILSDVGDPERAKEVMEVMV